MFASAREVLLSLFNDTPYKKEIKIIKDHNSYGDGSGINIMVETSTGLRLFQILLTVYKILLIWKKKLLILIKDM